MPPTAPPARWQRRKDARPQEVAAAALALFVEKGYAATRLEEVAARAGVSKGTLYLYFDSKEALFKAVVREGLVPLLAAGEELVDSSQLSAEDLFRTLVLTWWQQVALSPLGGLPKLIVAEARNFPELARFYSEEVIERAKRLMSKTLRRGVDRGEFRPLNPGDLVHIVFSPLMMRLVWQHSLGCCGVPTLPDETFIREYTELMLRGLRADTSKTATRSTSAKPTVAATPRRQTKRSHA